MRPFRSPPWAPILSHFLDILALLLIYDKGMGSKTLCLGEEAAAQCQARRAPAENEAFEGADAGTRREPVSRWRCPSVPPTPARGGGEGSERLGLQGGGCWRGRERLCRWLQSMGGHIGGHPGVWVKG